jgi:hypothetical protein
MLHPFDVPELSTAEFWSRGLKEVNPKLIGSVRQTAVWGTGAKVPGAVIVFLARSTT